MKRMKIALMAVLAVFMGTTFISCLDSDSDPTRQAFVSINDFMGALTLKTEDGLTFVPQNPQQMYKSDGSIPSRAFILYELLDGESFQEGVTEYKVVFKSYEFEYTTRRYSEVEIETATPLLGIYDSPLWAANGYINVAFAYYQNKDVTSSNFELFIDRVENNTVYFKLAMTREAEKSDYYTNGFISFILPYESEVKELYPDLTADKDGYYDAYVVAEGVDQTGEKIELKTNQVIKVPFLKY